MIVASRAGLGAYLDFRERCRLLSPSFYLESSCLSASAAAAFGLMALAAFTVILTRQIASRVPEPCACFGTADARPVSWFAVARNIAMALALVPAAVRPPVIEAQLIEGLPWDVQALALVAAAILVGLAWTTNSLRTLGRAQGLESR
jgi:hypothetical protein